MKLKEELMKAIQWSGNLPLDYLHQIGKKCGKKQSTTERYLRELERDKRLISAVFNTKKYITGYKWAAC